MRRLPLPLLPAWFRWSVVFAVAAVIFYFSILTVPQAPESPGPLWDKKLHFAAYGGFTLALAYATATWRTEQRIRMAAVLLVGLIYGVGIEIAQGALPNRYFGFNDLLANLLGSLLASVWFVIEPRMNYISIFVAT